MVYVHKASTLTTISYCSHMKRLRSFLQPPHETVTVLSAAATWTGYGAFCSLHTDRLRRLLVYIQQLTLSDAYQTLGLFIMTSNDLNRPIASTNIAVVVRLLEKRFILHISLFYLFYKKYGSQYAFNRYATNEYGNFFV
jgi:hypothetical protein